MLKVSTRTAILSAALLMPATAFSQEKPETKTKQAKPVVELVEEVAVKEVSLESPDGKKDEQEVIVVVEQDSKKPVVVKTDAEGKHEIRVIEVNGDDMPQQIRVIMKSLNGLNGELKDNGGKPQVLSFSFDTDGKLKATTSKIDQTIQEAIESINVSVDGVEENGSEKRLFRILRNGKPGAGQPIMLKGEAIDLKELSKELSGVNGTISISTSSSSSSKNGEEPNVVTNSQVRIIGPDGKVQEMNFGGKGPGGASMSKAIEEALKKSGREIPEDVMKRVEEALNQARKRTINVQSLEVSAAKAAAAKAAGSAKAAVAKAKKDHERRMAEHKKQVAEMQKRSVQPSGKAIEKKLDLILKRLEKMEQEIETLKKK